MDTLDRDIEKAERDASPDRFPIYGQNQSAARHEPLERTVTASSGGSSSTSSSEASIVREEIGMSRIPTVHESAAELERHPTALSRIQTQRSQHSQTVGASLTSRSRRSNKPLPPFGAGKPYPPSLPAQEEYVVEFSGHDDPMHAQNWPLREK